MIRQHWKGLLLGLVVFVAIMHDPNGAAHSLQHIGSKVGDVAARFGDFLVALIG